jgi:hypothetical protein
LRIGLIFNQQRRQCLVEITSNRPQDDQMSVYDQIFEPKEGSFVASRTGLPELATPVLERS